jgi:DNA/RNA-binding domain of Phe-tRNA-synthetase-like protein
LINAVPALGTRDPTLTIPVLLVALRGLTRSVPPTEIAAAAGTYVANLLASQTYAALAECPALAGYRALHAERGKTGRQYLPAPESLLKRLFTRGEWRPLDPLVDAYTLVSLRTLVSIGAHDLARLSLPINLTPTVGGESLLAIGDTTAQRLGANEYCYRDSRGQVLGRMECRQAQATQVRASTCDVLFILQGHAQLGGPALHAAATQLLASICRWVGPATGGVSMTALD